MAIENVVDCIIRIFKIIFSIYIYIYIWYIYIFNYAYIYIYLIPRDPMYGVFTLHLPPTQFFRQRDQPHHEFLGFILMFTMNNDHGRMIDWCFKLLLFILPLRIQVCPIRKGLSLHSYSKDGIGNWNPKIPILGRGLDS